MTVRIKEGASPALKQYENVTKQPDTVRMFTIPDIDRDILRCDREIANQEAEKARLQGLKAEVVELEK